MLIAVKTELIEPILYAYNEMSYDGFLLFEEDGLKVESSINEAIQ